MSINSLSSFICRTIVVIASNDEAMCLVSVGTLVGMLLLKKVFRLGDTTVILIGLFMNIIDVGTIALATSTAFIYIGTLICDGFVVAILPASQSFLATLVAPDEVRCTLRG